MNNAPKKIYLKHWLNKWYDDKRKEGDTAYIRADLVDEMQETLETVFNLLKDPCIIPNCPCRQIAFCVAQAALEGGKVVIEEKV